MIMLYFKRKFDESRVEDGEVWGTCIYYFETNGGGEVIRQIEVYEKGKRLKYSEEVIEDKFGFLADQAIDVSEFEKFAITKDDFEFQWREV